MVQLPQRIAGGNICSNLLNSCAAGSTETFPRRNENLGEDCPKSYSLQFVALPCIKCKDIRPGSPGLPFSRMTGRQVN